ncbi:uncharacterized protein LOC110849753 isoform X2 [Folsomia candida]|uniref:Uncharacterized protein n=2 Tax=Folsomia candida TaxID=158441 RepID=A0A226ED79_FOLCA|nr:uncharacterized protein LOC110849753 isoform X2 [Folsomia candida]OXA55094.1 hypothetical protein Fcan01_10298 [Folsomia candida]
MDAPTLKSARSVCTLWADLGASLLAKQVSVTFTAEQCCRKEISKELGSLDPKLTRSVILIMAPPPCCWISLPENFATNLPHVSHHIVELDVTMSSKFVPALEQMWIMHHFPNLRQLTITVVTIEVDDQDNSDLHDEEADVDVEFIAVTPKIPKFMALPNLAFLKIVVSDRYDSGRDDGISSICQGLLNSASDILNVDIHASFFPDFTTCTNLEVLSYTLVQFLYNWVEEYGNVDMSKLTGMLDACRNSLTGLTLSFPRDLENFAPVNFMLPSIPNLSVINIRKMYPLGNFLHPVNLPNLTHVTFSDYNSSCLSLTDIFQNFDLPHERITSLDVEAFYTFFDTDVETAAKIVRLFPSVTNFRLKLTVFDELNLPEMLQSFATWDLTSGLVEIESGQKSTDLLAVLRGVVWWQGLAHTAVNFDVLESPKFVLDDEMKEILLLCRSLRWIKISGFRMEEEERKKFEEFIEEHALQISLLNWVN